MDRSRRRPGFLAGALLLALLGAAPAAAPPLRAMRWLPPGADSVRLLTRGPPECLRLPADPRARREVELGRAAFRDPLVLGGQAARAGLSCETCHQNGRANRTFDFPGVSGPPGTADVTSFVFSSHRGDHIDDPRPIPDLGGPRRALKVARDPATGALEHFISGLITQEFDGARPTPAVLAGLTAYVRALTPEACPRRSDEPIAVAAALLDLRRDAAVAQGGLARNDPASAIVGLQAARARLAAIWERYAGANLAADADRLRLADVEIAAIQAKVRAGDPSARSDLQDWISRARPWRDGLVRDEPRSLYSPAVLARVISGPTG